jgi:hypothetical protein
MSARVFSASEAFAHARLAVVGAHEVATGRISIARELVNPPAGTFWLHVVPITIAHPNPLNLEWS